MAERKQLTLRSTQVNKHNAKELGLNSSFQDKHLYFKISPEILKPYNSLMVFLNLTTI